MFSFELLNYYKRFYRKPPTTASSVKFAYFLTTPLSLNLRESLLLTKLREKTVGKTLILIYK